MGTIVTIRYGTSLPAADVADRLDASRTIEFNRLKRALADLIDPVATTRGAAYVVTVDDVDSGTILADVAVTATITFANITAGETLVIGNVTLTWAVAAANENEVTIGANLAAATTNLTNAINAHSKLTGLITASGNTATGVVTITYPGADRTAALIGLSETGDALVLSATSFTSGATLTSETSVLTARKGI